jgi:hypothetical protein
LHAWLLGQVVGALLLLPSSAAGAGGVGVQ